MKFTCNDCGAVIDFPENVLINEIISCQDCGLDYVVIQDESGALSLSELQLEGEDWGE